jgi:hypothetical protein
MPYIPPAAPAPQPQRAATAEPYGEVAEVSVFWPGGEGSLSAMPDYPSLHLFQVSRISTRHKQAFLKSAILFREIAGQPRPSTTHQYSANAYRDPHDQHIFRFDAKQKVTLSHAVSIVSFVGHLWTGDDRSFGDVKLTEWYQGTLTFDNYMHAELTNIPAFHTNGRELSIRSLVRPLWLAPNRTEMPLLASEHSFLTAGHPLLEEIVCESNTSFLFSM